MVNSYNNLLGNIRPVGDIPLVACDHHPVRSSFLGGTMKTGKSDYSCKHAERIIIKYVENGELKIDGDGNIWRIAGVSVGGYRVIRKRYGNNRFQAPAHRIVWQYHKGDIPDGLQINHIDGNKQNNHISNLETVTPLENTRHAIRTGLRCNKGENHPMAKLTEDKVREIRRLYGTGEYSWRKLGKAFGVSKTHIGYIVKHKSWKDVK